MRLACLAVLLLVGAVPARADVSYRSLTRKERAERFFRRAGEGYRGMRVHLHLPARAVLAKPERVRTRRGLLFLFPYRTVPLVFSPRSVYLRKIRQRARRGERVCVKGTVRDDPRDPGRRALWVHTVKKAP